MEKKCENLDDVVNSICEGIRLLPPGPRSQELRHIESVIEAKLILDFAPKIGRDLIRMFEDHPWLQSFNAGIKWEFEDGDDGYLKMYSYEDMSVTVVESQRNGRETSKLEWQLLDMISDDPPESHYPALCYSPYMVCAAVGYNLSSSREIYDRLNLAGELTPMNMYIESAKEKYEELVAKLSETYESDETDSSNTPARPRG